MKVYLADALGSVRRAFDNQGTPEGLVFYDPWGMVESGALPRLVFYHPEEPVISIDNVPAFGFTGELHDAASGLVNLRARWYTTAKGIFTSRDPFTGFSEQPYSLHSYEYGYSDPVLRTDPTGQIPELRGFSKNPPWFTYSCNCGWIDWRHAGPDHPATTIINYVKSAMSFFNNPATMCENFYLIPAKNIDHHTGKFGINVQTTRDDVLIPNHKVNQGNWQQVAMGIFRLVEENVENAQSLPGVSLFSESGFSEEDLVSDLLGFYGAIQGYTGDSEVYRKWLAGKCRFPTDPKERQEWSLKVFNEYPEYTRNETWESPIFKSTPCIRHYRKVIGLNGS